MTDIGTKTPMPGQLGPPPATTSSLSLQKGQSLRSLLPKVASSAISPGPTSILTQTREGQTQGIIKSRYSKRVESEIFSIKFSPDSQYIAAGLGNGTIEVYETTSGILVSKMKLEDAVACLPCTNISFRPPTNDARAKNVLAATYSDGHLAFWHATTGKMLTSVIEEANQLNTVEFSHNVAYFATGGADQYIRVYDEPTRKCLISFRLGFGEVTAGHSNRVFCVKFHPSDSNILISGGWDNTIQMWDMRMSHSFRSIHEPHVCGESLDWTTNGETILAGSYDRQNQLTTWSYQEGKLIDQIPWSITEDKSYCMLYSAQYSKGTTARQNRFVLAGGGGEVNEVKLFNEATKRCVGAVQNLSHTIYSTAISRTERFMACGGGEKMLRVFDVEPSLMNQIAEFVY